MSECNKLFKEALGGIDFTYKLDTVLSSLNPKQKFSKDQLEGYLKKQGVSPKEIKQSGIFEQAHTRPITAEEWIKTNPGKHRLTEEVSDAQEYADITLNPQEAVASGTYREQLTLVNKPDTKAPQMSHFAHDVQGYNEQAIMNETDQLLKRQDEIDKELAKLPDLGINPENGTPLQSPKEVELYNELNEIEKKLSYAVSPTQEKTLLGWRRLHDESINGKPTTVLNELQSDWAQSERSGRGLFKSTSDTLPTVKELEVDRKRLIAVDQRANEILKQLNGKKENITPKLEEEWNNLRKEKIELIEKDRRESKLLEKAGRGIVADFPMSEKKFHQYQIVAAINEAIETGTNRVAIPINREGALHGTPGVTKFYDSLDKKVLPEIRKKLEKQGMRIKTSREDYGGSDEIPNGHALDWHYPEHLDSLAEEMPDDLANIIRESIYMTENAELPVFNGDSLRGVDFGKFQSEIDEAIEQFDWYKANGKVAGSMAPEPLHILEIEEIPNKKVRWDIYSVLGAIGLGEVADKLKEEDAI